MYRVQVKKPKLKLRKIGRIISTLGFSATRK